MMSEVNDVISNTAGAMLGFGLWIIFKNKGEKNAT